MMAARLRTMGMVSSTELEEEPNNIGGIGKFIYTFFDCHRHL
jgi:hypothetical protein